MGNLGNSNFGVPCNITNLTYLVQGGCHAGVSGNVVSRSFRILQQLSLFSPVFALWGLVALASIVAHAIQPIAWYVPDSLLCD